MKSCCFGLNLELEPRSTNWNLVNGFMNPLSEEIKDQISHDISASFYFRRQDMQVRMCGVSLPHF